MRSISDARSAPRSNGFPGGHRQFQPTRERDVRKEPQPDPKSMISMPDGGSITEQDFHNFRSTSHQKMGSSLRGCARLIKQNIPRSEWVQLDTWMGPYRNRYRNIDTCNDNLMAVLLDYAGSRMNNRLSPETALLLIVQEETAKIMLPRPEK